MKKMLLSTLAGVMIMGMSLTTTSCDKIENSQEWLALVVLVAECQTLSEADYTPQSWAAFREALHIAEQVTSNIHPTLESLNKSTADLRAARSALVRRTT